jgi:DNA-binding GntR family transcriptional regulator
MKYVAEGRRLNRAVTDVSPAGRGRGVATAAETDNSRAYSALKKAVLAGTFRPGDVLTLRALAAHLALGDTPVREAVKRLISEGAFEGLPNRSARVPQLDRREVLQLLDLRLQLESNAAALAAENISSHQIELLRTMHKAMGEAVTADDAQKYGELNMAFHFEIYKLADNQTLAKLIEVLWLRMAPMVSRTRSLITGTPEDAWHVFCGQHEVLLKAFQSRDAEGARAAMRDDLSALPKMIGYWEGIEDASIK